MPDYGEAKYNAGAVANFFINSANDERIELTPMKLLKLVYIAYGWNSTVSDKPLFAEPIMAWKHGPVIESLYHEFKDFGNQHISRTSKEFDLEKEFAFGKSVYTEPQIKVDDEETLIVLDKVWQVYKNVDAWTLRNNTHEQDTPWTETMDKTGVSSTIPPEIIEAYFAKKMDAYLGVQDE